jgi:hypothetical protein
MFIRKFYVALTEITILDPTCGSGAFLFAALNILEPLYEVCIHRMEEFYNANPKDNKDFEDRLAQVKSGEHPNLSYYIYKTIILHNLYGVDLMKEAVEIAKLRLFLKLVAEVDPSRRKKNYGLEPLPDIDFNIRFGNTLIGFATKQQLEEVVKSTEGELIYKEKLEGLKSACGIVAATYSDFQKIQKSSGSNSDKYKEIKKTLRDELKELDEKLNRYLADTYGLGAKTQWKSKKEKEEKYEEWKLSHQPFHWLAEFYDIISKGGFDVVIGNPPYVEYKDIHNIYQIKNINCISAGNLYAFVIERVFSLVGKHSRIGMIIQLSAFCTPRMLVFQEEWLKHSQNSYLSFFDDRPGKLFDGLEHIRVAICINQFGASTNPIAHTTNYIKFLTEMRPSLFNNIKYIENARFIDSIIPKLNRKVEQDILAKTLGANSRLEMFFYRGGKDTLYYHNAPQYFIRAHSFIPYFWNEKDGEKISVQNKTIPFENKEQRDITITLLVSSLFYWWFVLQSDCRHLNAKEISSFPFDLQKVKKEHAKDLIKLASQFEVDIKKNAYRKDSKL